MRAGKVSRNLLTSRFKIDFVTTLTSGNLGKIGIVKECWNQRTQFIFDSVLSLSKSLNNSGSLPHCLPSLPLFPLPKTTYTAQDHSPLRGPAPVGHSGTGIRPRAWSLGHVSTACRRDCFLGSPASKLLAGQVLGREHGQCGY